MYLFSTTWQIFANWCLHIFVMSYVVTYMHIYTFIYLHIRITIYWITRTIHISYVGFIYIYLHEHIALLNYTRYTHVIPSFRLHLFTFSSIYTYMFVLLHCTYIYTHATPWYFVTYISIYTYTSYNWSTRTYTHMSCLRFIYTHATPWHFVTYISIYTYTSYYWITHTYLSCDFIVCIFTQMQH